MLVPATQKIYEQDAFCTSLSTTLCGVDVGKNGTVKIALAASIFFAEGGGQPADCGVVTFASVAGQGVQAAQASACDEAQCEQPVPSALQARASECDEVQNIATQGGFSANILDVHEQGGVLWHTLDAPPDGLDLAAAIDCAVHCTLDWAHRLDSMQQHSGEHVLSGILHQLYGAENVGFHIGSSAVRMDTSCPLTAEELQIAEHKANEIIWQDVPIETLLPTAEALIKMTYRSKKEIDGQVRIVRIANADTCACCGTHLRTTGQIGQIKIIASEHYKGGERLSVACGKRALVASQGMRAREAEIGALLSAKPELTAAAVQRVYAEYNALKFAKQGIELQLFEALAAQVAAGARGSALTLADAAQSKASRTASDAPSGTDVTANDALPSGAQGDTQSDAQGGAQSGAPVIFTVSGLTPDGLHKLAGMLSEQTQCLCAALCEQPSKADHAATQPSKAAGTAPNGTSQASSGAEHSITTGYCLAQSGAADIRPLCKALNTALQGRGGGKPNICQGSARASAAEITAFLQTYDGT